MKTILKFIKDDWALIIMLLIGVMIGIAFAADTKLSALTELATVPASSDEFYVNDGGTSKKIQYSNLVNRGIADDNVLEVDGSPNANEYARFTANGLEGRTEAEFKGDFNLEAGTDFNAYDADLATLAGPTAWRLFYSNGSSVITELALGADGTYLKSNGATSTPSFDTPGGSGDITDVLDCASGDCDDLIDAPTAFTSTDTTPDVSSGAVFITANASATTISDFDTELTNGKIIFVIVNDANTTFDFTSSGLEGMSNDYLADTGDLLIFVYTTTDNQWHGTMFPKEIDNITLSGFTANRALETDGSGNLEASAVTDTELALLDGKTGNLVTDATACTDIEGRSLSISGGTLVAEPELYTHTECIYIEDPDENDDLQSIHRNSTANDWTITEIWAESDQTVNFDLQIDDGTPADVNGTDISPSSGEAEDTSLSGDTTLGVDEELDLAITSVSGTPTWVSICWTYTIND